MFLKALRCAAHRASCFRFACVTAQCVARLALRKWQPAVFWHRAVELQLPAARSHEWFLCLASSARQQCKSCCLCFPTKTDQPNVRDTCVTRNESITSVPHALHVLRMCCSDLSQTYVAVIMLKIFFRCGRVAFHLLRTCFLPLVQS